MTAINVILQRDRSIMITDGAGLNPDGTLGAIAPKVFQMPHLNAVMAVRGVKAVHAVLADFIAPWASSYDELANILPNKLRDNWRPQKERWEKAVGPGSGDWELFIAGWSKTRGPHSYAIASSGLNSPSGLRPWTLTELGDCCIAPDDGSLFERHGKSLVANYRESEAIEMMNGQRLIKTPYGSSGHPVGSVGGFIQQTTITEQEIQTRIIHRWSDVVGTGLAA